MGVEWDIKCRVNFGKPVGARDTSISGKGPAKTRLPCVRCNQAPATSDEDHGFENNGAGTRLECLVEKLQYGDLGWGVEKCIQVVHAEEHSDRVKPLINTC